MRMYSRSTGRPSSRWVSRSSSSTAAPSGTCRIAAECASAGTASTARLAFPSRCAGDLLDEREDVVGLEGVRDDGVADVRREVGHVEAERQVAEIAQPFDEDDRFAGAEREPVRHRRRRRHRHRGAHFVADVAVALERLLEADERVEAVVVLADGDVGAGARPAVDEPFVLQRGQRLANGVAGDEELGREIGLRQAVRRGSRRRGSGGGGRRPPGGPGRPADDGWASVRRAGSLAMSPPGGWSVCEWPGHERYRRIFRFPVARGEGRTGGHRMRRCAHARTCCGTHRLGDCATCFVTVGFESRRAEFTAVAMPVTTLQL